MPVLHQVKGFPCKFSTKTSLKKHLKRIIWVLTAQHSALNYPIDHLGALTPNIPTKLYKDPRVGFEHYSIYNLPRAFTGGVSSHPFTLLTIFSLHKIQMFQTDCVK